MTSCLILERYSIIHIRGAEKTVEEPNIYSF